jgi:hypothetical protein
MYTTLDAAVLKLVELCTGVFSIEDPDVEVLDGPSVDDVGQDVLAIGLTASDSTTDAEIQIAGLMTDRETYEIECLVRSWTGDDDLPSRRARAIGMYERVAAIIVGNPTLDKTVAKARISGVSYFPARLPEGAVASVTFRVRIDAFTR